MMIKYQDKEKDEEVKIRGKEYKNYKGGGGSKIL